VSALEGSAYQEQMRDGMREVKASNRSPSYAHAALSKPLGASVPRCSYQTPPTPEMDVVARAERLAEIEKARAENEAAKAAGLTHIEIRLDNHGDPSRVARLAKEWLAAMNRPPTKTIVPPAPVAPPMVPATLGRVVHYTTVLNPWSNDPPRTLAAHVAEVTGPDAITVYVLDPKGEPYFIHDVKQAAEPKQGCWHWPPRA
jgi:hypothetical protein